MLVVVLDEVDEVRAESSVERPQEGVPGGRREVLVRCELGRSNEKMDSFEQSKANKWRML